MDKFDRNRGGDRFNDSSEEPQNFRQPRGGGAPFHQRHQENYRGGGGGRDGSHGYRSGFSTGGGRGSGRDNHRAFESPPPYPSPPSGGGGGIGGVGLRPVGDGIAGFQPMIGSGDGFGPMGGGGGRGFRPMGGGGFRPMGGGIDVFAAMGGGSGAVDGGRFPVMGEGGTGGRFGQDNYPMGMPPPSLSGQKRGYPFSGRERSPGREGTNFAKLFVGSVPRTATEDDIRPLFDKHGRVMEVALIRDKRTGQQQGCCFIKYASAEDADRAIGALHNQYTLPGGTGPIQVRYADGERERLGATEYKLFVGSLNKQATEKEVEEIFLPYGRVEDVYLMRDEMKQSRGCGFVKFSQREIAQAAIEGLNGIYTMRGCDQPLTVRFADPKRPRPGESRGGPSYGGPGFGPQFSGPGIRPPPDGREQFRGPAPNSWPPVSPPNLGPPSHVGNHGFGSQFPPRSGDIAVSSASGPTGVLPGSVDGSYPGPAVSSAPVSQLRPVQSPQPLPHSGQLQPINAATFSTFYGTQGSQMQPGQMQNRPSYGQAPSAHQLPGQNGQLSGTQNQVQRGAPSTHGQAPGIANQQQPHPHQQQPLSQSPSELAQMLSHQKQTLQATFQSSQQALNQLQQQLQQLQPANQNLTTQQGQIAAKQQSPWAGTLTQPAGNNPSNNKPAGDLAATTSVSCNWSEHTSPDGYKYYYNSVTGESKWEKPEELTVFEQQQQKPSNQHPQVHSQVQVQLQQAHQMQVQLQGQQQAQIPKPLQQAQSSYQVPGFSAKQGSKELGYTQAPAGTVQMNDPRYQQASQEWMWKNKHSGM